MPKKKRRSRRYWLWITRPEYYLDENGDDRECLDPSSGTSVDDWWTCHHDTKRGDLVLLYRTTPKRDFGYLIQVESNAYSIADDEHAIGKGWDFACDYRVLRKFNNPVTLADLRKDADFDEWGPLRAQFRRKAYRVAPEYWRKLMALIARSDASSSEFIDDVESEEVSRVIRYEEELEDALSRDLKRFLRFGYDLVLFSDTKSGLTGQQLVCKGDGGRIDLLCYDRRNDQYVVLDT